jgi:hypothetical protein
MWRRLQTTYHACLPAGKIRLQGDFAAISMQPKESAEANFGRARGLINDLVSCDEPITEDSSITRVFEGLSPAFSNLVETFVFQVAADPEKWNCDRVLVFVLEGEACLARYPQTAKTPQLFSLGVQGEGPGEMGHTVSSSGRRELAAFAANPGT